MDLTPEEKPETKAEPRLRDIPTIVMRLEHHVMTSLQNVPQSILSQPTQLLYFLKHVQEIGWENDTRPMMADLVPVLERANATGELWLQLIFSEMSLRGFYGDPFTTEEYLTAFPLLQTQILAWFPTASNVHHSGQAPVATPMTCFPRSSAVPSPGHNPDYPNIPGYEIEDTIGRGGMGIVFRARQLGLDRIVALKVIVSGYNTLDADRTRFRLEAEAVGRVRHPNIVQVFGCGEHQGVPWLALEYVPGGTLSQLTRDQPQDLRFSACLVETVAHAVAAAHRCSIIHRDLKPANILLEVYPADDASAPVGARLPDGRQIVPRITDFGLALRTDREPIHLTSHGVIAGTPGYMAPEQIAVGERRVVGTHSDIWALGVMLYELTTGQLPFTGVSSYDIVEQVVRGHPLPPRSLRPEIPRDLEIVCLKCLEKAPALRYANATELAADLRRFLDGKPILARPIGSAESAIRWVRRNPSTAAMLLCLVASLIAWTSASLHQAARAAEELRSTAAQAHQIREQKIRADRMDDRAEELVERIDRQTEQLRSRAELRDRELYASRMLSAHRAWESGQVARTREILESYEPLRPDAVDYRGFEWFHMNRSIRAELRTFATLTPAVGVAFSPLGDRVALAERACFRIVRISDYREILRIDDDSSPITSIAWSPTSEHLLIGDSMGMVRLRDARTGDLLRTPAQLVGSVGKVAFSPDGRSWAAFSFPASDGDSSLGTGEIVYGDSTGIRKREAPAIGRILDLSFGFAGCLAVVSKDRILWVVDTATHLAVRRTFVATPTAVAVSPVSDLIALGWNKGGVSLYDPLGRRELWRNSTSTNRTTSIDWSPDGRWLLTGGVEPIVRLRSATTGETIRAFRGHSSAILAARFSPKADSTTIASVSEDRSIRLWSSLGNDSETSATVPHPPIRVFPIGDDDTLCLMCDGSISRVSPLSHRVESISLSATPSDARDGCLLADRSGILTVHADSKVTHTSLRTGSVSVWNLPGMRSAPTRIATRGNRVALGFEDGSIAVYDLETKGLPVVLSSHDSAVDSLDFSPDGKLLISGGREGRVRIVDLVTGRVRLSQQLHEGRVAVVRFGPSGETFASGGDDTRIHLRRLEDCRPLCPPMAHAGPVRDLLFTSDCQRIASCGDDLALRIWDVATGEETMTLRVPADMSSLAVSPSHRLTLAGNRSLVRSWAGDPIPRTEELIRNLARMQVTLELPMGPLAVGSKVRASVVLKTTSASARRLSPEALADWKRTVRLTATIEADPADQRPLADAPLPTRIPIGRWSAPLAPNSEEPTISVPIEIVVPEVVPGRYRIRVELIREDLLVRTIASDVATATISVGGPNVESIPPR